METSDYKAWCRAALGAVLVLAPSSDVIAGDHAEAPGVENDVAADIADVYAWHTDSGQLVLVLTFGGYALVADPPAYDADVLYGFHIDTNGDNTADHDIWARFGEDDMGNWGIQVVDVPGASGPIEGPVDTTIEADGIKVFAGLRDDPFFFDKEGYVMTLTTGTLSFDSGRDFALFQNATSIVLELPLANVASGPFSVWATTGRK